MKTHATTTLTFTGPPINKDGRFRTMTNYLLVANYSPNVGYAWWLMERFWSEVADIAQSRRREAYLIYPDLGDASRSVDAQTVSPVHKDGMIVDLLDYEDRSPRGSLRMLIYLRRNHIGFIYLTDKPFFSLRYLFFRMVGVKIILVHDHSPGRRDAETGVFKVLKAVKNRIPLITADGIIAVSEYVQNRHRTTSCIPERKSFVARNGIEPIDIARPRPRVQEVLGIPDSSVVVFTSGRASAYKGIDFIVECANVLINAMQYDNVHFVYCGDGPDLPRCRDLVARYQLQRRFLFLGRYDDVGALAISCDIGMHAAKGEVGFSLSILEYMSAGLATLVPDNPSVSAATIHGDTGLVYEEGSVASACKYLVHLIEHPELRALLGSNAAKVVARDYNIEGTVNSFRRIVASLS